MSDLIIVHVGRSRFAVHADDSVSRIVAGEYKPVKGGKQADAARRKASNIRAIRASAARRAARS